MITTLVVLALSAVFFVNGKIRSDIVGLCALVSLMLTGILTPAEALSGFSNSIVIMMVGLFIVGGGIFQTGLAKKISGRILELAGNSELKLFVFTMLVTAAIGAFVSNTGTVALMLPIVVSLAAGSGMSSSRLLMPMAFASSMGGMMTLIGTPPNLVIQNVLTDAGFDSLSFFSFTPVGLICIAVGLLVLIPLSKRFLSRKDRLDDRVNERGKSQRELVREYQLSRNLFRVRVTGTSLLRDKKLSDLNITQKYGVSVLEIRRKPVSQKSFFKTLNQEMAGPNSVLLENDVLYLLGSYKSVEEFAAQNDLSMIDFHETEEVAPVSGGYKIGIAEVLLMPNSSLINQAVKDTGFREEFNVNILGIQRKGEYILQKLKDEKIYSGDVLLVQGTWENIARLSKNQTDYVVVGQPAEEAAKVTLDYKAPLAAFIMLLMIIGMCVESIPTVAAVMVASILMILTGCLRNVEAAYKTINWESIVLIGSMLPMSLALEKTGASALIAEKLASGLGGYGPIVLLAGVYFTTSLLTMFISNTATAVLLAPIALKSAVDIGVSPFPFLFAVTVAASMCFASPFSTPPNALVMPAGQYSFMDYIKVGAPLQIIMGIVMIIVLPLLFPF